MVAFRTTVAQMGNNTGFVVPEEIVESFGAGRRVPVVVTVGGHSYRSTIASMAGAFRIPLSLENRTAAGVAGGDEVELQLEHDTAERTVEVPAELAAALDAAGVSAAFDALAYSTRKEHARTVTEAKAEATRIRRIEKIVGGLR